MSPGRESVNAPLFLGAFMLKSTLLALFVAAALPGAAMAGEWTDLYFKFYGGGTAEDEQFAGVQKWDLLNGHFLGASVGLSTPIEGLSVELDVSHSRAYYIGKQNALEATLAMANVVYSLPVGEQFSVYGGAGLGFGYVLDDCIVSDVYDSDGYTAAGQVFAGAEMKLFDHVSLFGEARYQSALDRVTVTDNVPDTYGVDYARLAVLFGLKVSL